MKRSMTVLVALAVLALGGAAWAADTNTLTVQATVAGTCRFTVATSTLDFGALDPSSTADALGSTTTNFWCTKGVVTGPITAGNGSNWDGASRNIRDTVSGDVIPYSLTLTPDLLLNGGPTVTRTLTIAGSIVNANYTAKTAGSYADTVLLTLNP